MNARIEAHALPEREFIVRVLCGQSLVNGGGIDRCGIYENGGLPGFWEFV